MVFRGLYVFFLRVGRGHSAATGLTFISPPVVWPRGLGDMADEKGKLWSHV